MIQDEKLKKLVEQNGTEDWKVIANFLPVSGYWFLFPGLVATLYQGVSLMKGKGSGCFIVTFSGRYKTSINGDNRNLVRLLWKPLHLFFLSVLRKGWKKIKQANMGDSGALHSRWSM